MGVGHGDRSCPNKAKQDGERPVTALYLLGENVAATFSWGEQRNVASAKQCLLSGRPRASGERARQGRCVVAGRSANALQSDRGGEEPAGERSRRRERPDQAGADGADQREAGRDARAT